MAPPHTLLFRSLLPAFAGLATLLPAGTLRAQEGALNPQNDRAEIVHVLNRITFGPRPGDVEAVQKLGLHNYIEQQLHPETIDDSAVEQELAGFDLLQMSSQQLTQLYQEERKNQLKRQKKLVEAAAANGQAPAPVNAPAPIVPPNPAPMQETAAVQGAAPAPNVPTNSAVVLAGPLQNCAGGQANANAQGTAPAPDVLPPPAPVAPPPPTTPRERIAKALDQANQNRSVAAIGELEQAKLVRAIDSPRQLQEVLVDFWGNHFNIDMKKGVDRYLKVVDDRDVIRPHILGRFRDLLEASAKSPAMLFYLDNATNTVAHTVTQREADLTAMVASRMTQNGNGLVAPPVPQVGSKKGGINENYAREIMELHTLGVDGGYTQQDVQEVARCFTGWSIDRQTGEFAFHPRQHDNGAKVVLGHEIPAGGGIQDGETVLDILASSPATAHHLALQMCQRFVSDDPSPALVDRIAGVFTQTGGDLRQVTEAILTSPEFLSPANFNNKIKSPLEFAVSAVRASESTIVAQQPPPFDKIVPALEGSGVLGRGAAADRISKRPRQSLNWHILELGEPLFACTPPTGYKEVSKFWVSPGALIERLNFAMALTQQELSDIRFSPQTILSGTDLDNPEAVLNQCVSVLLQNNITPTTRKVLEQTALPTGESKTVNPSKLIALIIGSPEFQRK
jgi:uncharacterized protein (DUF1800 family)